MRENGFSLLETLLVVALLAGIMVLLTSFSQDYFQKQKARGAAEYMQLVQDAVDQTIGTQQGFAEVYELAQANGGFVRISVLNPSNPNYSGSEDRPPTNSLSLETGGGSMPPSTIVHDISGFSEFSDRLPVYSKFNALSAGSSAREWGVPMEILARISNEEGAPRALEVLILTAAIGESDLWKIAQNMGASGGVISALAIGDSVVCDDETCAHTARSAYESWNIDMNAFGDVGALYVADSSDDAAGGYLASYAYYNEDILAGDYLYRKRIAGQPELNRMHAPLNMGGNNIVGIDNLDTDQLIASDSMHAQGSVYSPGSIGRYVDSAGTPGAPVSLLVEGDMQAGTAIFAGAADGQNNILSVQGDMVTGGLRVDDDMSVSGEATFNQISSGQVNVDTLGSAGDLYSTGALDLYVGGNVNTPQMTISNHIDAESITPITVNATNTGSVSGEIGGGIDVENQVVIQSDQRIKIQGQVDIDNVNMCEGGC